MYSDVVDLHEFYATPLGRTAQQVLRPALRRTWPNMRGLRLAGFGYATPYLPAFDTETSSAVALMPASQGVIAWPAVDGNRACLVEEECFPLADRSLDRILLVHALEHAPRPHTLLREIWRVLDGEGRLLIVVPNRRGLWARVDLTPFGWGRPFSRGQVTGLLDDMLFEPLSTERTLFVPPTTRRWLQRSAAAWESVGTRAFPRFGGVLLIEARKRLSAPAGAQPAFARRRAMPVLPSLTRRPSGAPSRRNGDG